MHNEELLRKIRTRSKKHAYNQKGVADISGMHNEENESGELNTCKTYWRREKPGWKQQVTDLSL